MASPSRGYSVQADENGSGVPSVWWNRIPREENAVPRIVVSEFLTLDGVMQAPGDPNEDRSGDFDRGGWQRPFVDDVFGQAMMEGFATTGGFLLGRRTYEIFAAHWPKQGPDDPLAAIFNDLPKYVVSNSLSEPLPWQNSTLISGDVVSGLAALRKQGGMPVQVIGSGELVQTLIQNDLVDEYRLSIHPITLGRGKRLFRDDSTPGRLQLIESKPTTTGVLMLTYVPSAAPVAAPEG
jgi:dihydrofolate reductase